MGLAAKRYAAAFYELADASGDWKTILKDLKHVSEWGTQKDFNSFCYNALLSREVSVSGVNALSKAANLNALTKTFLSVIAANRRLPLLQEIIKEVLKLRFQREDFLEADVTSTHKLSAEVLSGLEKMLVKQFKKKIFINQNIKPDVLGGMSVRIGSYLYDATLHHQLTQLSNNLKEA